MNLAESVLTALKDHGVRQLFGIPGDFALPLFKVIEEAHQAILKLGAKRIHIDLRVDHRLDKEATIASKKRALSEK